MLFLKRFSSQTVRLKKTQTFFYLLTPNRLAYFRLFFTHASFFKLNKKNNFVQLKVRSDIKT